LRYKEYKPIINNISHDKVELVCRMIFKH
jgi:hypothetical protein